MRATRAWRDLPTTGRPRVLPPSDSVGYLLLSDQDQLRQAVGVRAGGTGAASN
ncbi:MAG TPA: hypothetical protein VEV63_06640 [Streptosporangiaceae bacterium]|nr:hypothetical protein [Streptosporangiaceae bacterium]